MTPHLGFGLGGDHIEDNLLYLKCNATKEKEGGGEYGKVRVGGGEML